MCMKFRRTLTYFTSLHNVGYSFQGVPACLPSRIVTSIKAIQSFKNLITVHILQLYTKVDLMSK